MKFTEPFLFFHDTLIVCKLRKLFPSMKADKCARTFLSSFIVNNFFFFFFFLHTDLSNSPGMYFGICFE